MGTLVYTDNCLPDIVPENDRPSARTKASEERKSHIDDAHQGEDRTIIFKYIVEPVSGNVYFDCKRCAWRSAMVWRGY